MSGSDMTIGDFWKLQNVLPEFDDNKGVSLVMINSEKGGHIYNLLNKIDNEMTYASALSGNSMIEKSVGLPSKRIEFFQKWQSKRIIPLISKLTAVSFKLKLKKIIISFLTKIGLLSTVKSLFRRYR
jgi:hypothetical protein